MVKKKQKYIDLENNVQKELFMGKELLFGWRK